MSKALGPIRAGLAVIGLGTAILAASAAGASETITYTYDARGRLVQVVRSGTVNNGVTVCYAYDRGDNRKNVTSAPSDCATFSVATGNVSAPEGTPLNFTVNKIGGSQTAFTINYATANGTATVGSDYTATIGTLNFAAGETQKSVSVVTSDDAAHEADETVVFTLSNPSGGAVLTDAQATGAILNNDGVFFSVSDPFSAAEASGASISFVVTKTGSTSSNLTINYATADGTATSATDYGAKSGTLTFGPTETTKYIEVGLWDDATAEGTETFKLNLSGAPSGTSISDAQGIGTINDND